MPKQVAEIKTFQRGIISTPEEADIPIDASPFSLNIEPVNVDGRLEGIPEDSTKMAGVNASAMAKINDDGTKHIIYMDAGDSRIKQVADLDGTPSIVPLSSGAESSITTPTMAVNNKEVHIGTGNANVPKWAGFIENVQFDSAIPTTVQLADAQLINPSGFPDIYKAVEVGGYIYGIEWTGQRIYKFKVSDKSFVRQSETLFAKTQGICLSGDSSHLWILDVNGSETLINKVDLEDMVSEFNNVAHGSVTEFSDILVTGNSSSNRYLWFSRKSTVEANNLLYNVIETDIVSTGSISINNRTPLDDEWSGNVGAWINSNTVSQTPDTFPVNYIVGKVCLIDVGSTSRVGWVTQPVLEGVGTDTYWQHTAGTGNSRVILAHLVIQPVLFNQSVSNPMDKIYIIGTGLGVDFVGSNTMYSMSSLAGANGIGTYGASSGTGDTTRFLLNSTLDTDTDFSSSTYKAIGILHNGDHEIQSAYIFKHTSDANISGFEGYGTGRWMHGSALNAMSSAKESDINITFQETSADYGDGSTTPNAKIGFKASTSQFYKASFLYDGYQESPLSDDFKFTGVSTNGKGVIVKVEIRNITNINRRVSHVCLYRADADNVNDFVQESGFYRLVDVMKLNTSWTLKTESGIWSNYRFKKITDNNKAGASYDARTGISEVLTGITPSYELSTQLNNTHFIANIKQETLGELNNYILKSKPLRFNQFNYVADFLALPTKPTAIQGFNGRLYAFDENNTYRIEPNGFYIEDIYEGVGCRNAESIVVTEYGMFFADKNNIYMHDGQKPHPIGNPILRGHGSAFITAEDYRSAKSYSTLAKNPLCKIAYDGKRNAIVLFGEHIYSLLTFGQTNRYNFTVCLVYTIDKKRWDLWEVGSTITSDGSTPTSMPIKTISGTNGEVYYSNGTDLIYQCGHATNTKDWDFYTKEITSGTDTVDKKFYEAYIGGTPTAAGVSLQVDGTNVANQSISNTNNIAFDTATGKKIRVKLVNQTGVVDSIGIIYRQMKVSLGTV